MAPRVFTCLLGFALSIATLSASGTSAATGGPANAEIWFREHPRYARQYLEKGVQPRCYLAVALSAEDLDVLEQAFRQAIKEDGSTGPFFLELRIGGQVGFDPSDRFLDRFSDVKSRIHTAKGTQHRSGAGVLIGAQFLAWNKDQGLEMGLTVARERSAARQFTRRFPGDRKPWELKEREDLRVSPLGDSAFSPRSPKEDEAACARTLWCRPYPLRSPTPETAKLPGTFAVVALSDKEQDVLEQGFRRMIEFRKEGPFFLEVSPGCLGFAPSDSFLKRLADLGPQATNARWSGTGGVSLAVTSMKWLNDNEVDVTLSYRSGEKAGEGYSARFEKADGRWRLKKGSERLLWRI